MIANNDNNKQLPNELKLTFKELHVLKHLRKAGITKSFGFSCSYLFQLIFCLIFQNKNWFRTLESMKSDDLPAKDTVYRFLNQPTFAWRRFLIFLSAYTIGKVTKLTDHNRPKVFILDDSSYERNRSNGYKRRLESLQTAPEQIPDMINRAMNAGIDASYVLMDTWFTQQPLIKNMTDQGLDVIGMVKNLKQSYLVDGERVSLKELYRLATPIEGKKGLLRSIYTVQANDVPVKIVFVRNRNKKRHWLAILSTDCTLSDQEVIRIYGMRWDIEVFFKTTKSLLKLQKEFQSRSYDSLISHTTIVFTRYIVLSWQNRCSTDQRTLGGMFYELCDEISELD